MKNIYFVQAAKNANDNTVYLPYASGCLIAYAMQNEDITSEYKFKDIIFFREKIESVIGSIDDPFLVAFSCSLWNIEYSKALARKIKEEFPHCLIVFGGHYISENSDLLEQCPFIDFTVCGEGEQAFSALLITLLKGGDFDIFNLSYRCKNGIVNNKIFNDYKIEDYPSPYLTGIFDDYFKKYPDFNFHAILETNRGCPYDCAFCEWCFTKRIRYFPLERVKSELNWMSDKQIEYCFCADANFGISPRDIEIAKYVVSIRKKNGFPEIFRPTYAKTSDETVFEAGKILNLNGADKGVTISYQSLNEKTLMLIGRKEFSVESFSRLVAEYSAQGIPTYTELILGLPGETYQSFCDGLCRLLEAGQHNSLTIYQCQIYNNALMNNKEFQKNNGIKTVRVPIKGYHYKIDFNGITEYYEIVIATADMTTDEWVLANMFSIVLQAFHSMGLLRCFSIYMHREKGMGYGDFINRLMKYIFSRKGTKLNTIFKSFEDRFSDTASGDWVHTDERFGSISWFFDEAAFLDIVFAWDDFWEEIQPFLQQLDIPDDIFCDLLKYQKFIIRRPGITVGYEDFSYDFYNYFERIYRGVYFPLKKQICRIKLDTKICVSSWEEYAMKIVLSGKRRGETIVTNEKDAVLVENI